MKSFNKNYHISFTVTLLSQSMLEKENANPSARDAEQKMLEQAAVRDPLGAGVDNYARRLIANDITQQLVEAVGLIHRKLGTGNRVRHVGDEEDEMAPVVKDVYSSTFPHLPGSHQRHQLHSPALQLVNTITHVLSLHTAVEGAFTRQLTHKISLSTDDVTYMRQTLLRMLNVDNFDSSTKWRDPCLSYVLSVRKTVAKERLDIKAYRRSCAHTVACAPMSTLDATRPTSTRTPTMCMLRVFRTIVIDNLSAYRTAAHSAVKRMICRR